MEYDFWNIREHIIPFPTPDDGYTRMLFIGSTGAGKTTLVRQLIGTNPTTEHFPSTSSSKTTTCDLEIVLAEGIFRGVVTFLPKQQIQTYVEECVVAAALAQREQRRPQDVERKLLEHSEQRFRLSYILGKTPSSYYGEMIPVDADDEEEIESGEQDEQTSTPEEQLKFVEVIQKYLQAVRTLTESAGRDLEAHPDFPTNGSRQERYAFAQEFFENELYNYEAFQYLVANIVDEIKIRFDLLQEGQISPGQDGWPLYWTYATTNRKDFLTALNQFSNNSPASFGRLLTPLVQGIRVTGPFQPQWREGTVPHFAIMDGEGLGHTPDTATSLSTTITSRFERADAILLVDNAKQPVLAAPNVVLKTLVTSGHIGKLFICFTHLDALDEHSLPDLNARYEHVRNSLENVIANIGKELGPAASVKLRYIAEKRVFFVSKIQKKLPTQAAATRAQLNTLVNEIESLQNTIEPMELQPVYNNIYLLSFLHEAVQSFREAWKARLGLSSQPKRLPEHWTRIKALARRPAQLGLDEYDTLRPVADLIRETSEQIKKFLDAPTWEATNYQSEEDRQAAIDRIARELYSQLHTLARQQIIRDHRANWETAYFRYGKGSARVRADDIDTIYRDIAPLPDEIDQRESDAFLMQAMEQIRQTIQSEGGKLL